MVFVRAAAWVWLGVLPVVWCLPLEGVRNSAAQQQQQQHQQQQRHQPLSTLLEDLPPQDFAQDDYQALLARQPDNVASLLPLTSYDGSDLSSPFVSRLQEGLAAAAIPASGLQSDVAAAFENPALDNPDWLSAPVDPRDYILAQYLDRLSEASGSDNGSNSMGAIRKIRNSPNSSSSNSNILSSDSNSNSIDNNNSMSKRGWPHGMTRRRTTGLSLSIDASMKVLREALYLEMARKKQRQQLQRARANQQLLNSIGKRDVQHQLQLQQEEEGDNRSDLNHSRAQRN